MTNTHEVKVYNPGHSIIRRLLYLQDQQMKAEDTDDGFMCVHLDDAHSVGWDLEGTCADCNFYMAIISALPEIATLVLSAYNGRDWYAKEKAWDIMEKISRYYGHYGHYG